MTVSLTGIKHISFDFWNTLAIPSKVYAQKRTEFLAETYQVEDADAKRIYTSTKNFLDTLAEVSGHALRRDQALEILNAQFPKGRRLNTEGDTFTYLGDALDAMFIENPPTVPEPLTRMLDELKAQGYTISILSNTNFIRGCTLQKHVLDPSFGENKFIATHFSDEWGIAKPDSEFFYAMIRAARAMREALGYNDIIRRENILHIGDNAVTDGLGAQTAGIQHAIIQDPIDLAWKLREQLQ